MSLHRVTRKWLVLTLWLKFTVWPSGREFHLKYSLNGIFIPSWYQRSKRGEQTLWCLVHTSGKILNLDAKYHTSEQQECQLRICVDFWDLNNACTKDDFPLLVTAFMIDATTSPGALSFVNCTAGYNLIQMAFEDQDATAFRTPNGIFCYRWCPLA